MLLIILCELIVLCHCHCTQLYCAIDVHGYTIIRKFSYLHSCASSCPHCASFTQSNGYTKEEMKVVWETRKIFGLPELQPSNCTSTSTSSSSAMMDDDDDIKISCTAVRVPTLRAHCEAITIETALPVTAEAARYG